MISAHDLKSLLHFMYYGEVLVDQDRLQALLKTAETLRIKGLTQTDGQPREEPTPRATVPTLPDVHVPDAFALPNGNGHDDSSPGLDAHLTASSEEDDGDVIEANVTMEELDESFGSEPPINGRDDPFPETTPDRVLSLDRESNFSTGETVALMRVWSQRDVQESLRRSKSHRRIYEVICHRLKEQGAFKTGRKCQTKVANTLQWYRRTKKLGRPVVGSYGELFGICDGVLGDHIPRLKFERWH
jgi:hypothetical protein